MPLENRADHQFAAYDDPQECAQHLAFTHLVGVQHPYEIDQHWSLHFHSTGAEPEPDAPAEYADAAELNPHPDRACPHCGGRLTILIRRDLADRASEAAKAVHRALADYMAAASDVLRFAEPFDPEHLG